MIANENNQLENAKQEYEKEKEGKKKRAAKITGEKFKYEIDFE